MTSTQVLLTIAVIAAVTFATRALPFLLFPPGKPTPAYVAYLGRVLPFAIIGMLIIYCLKSVNLLVFPYGLPELLSVAAVVALHKWKHRLLLSICGGTILYMVLVQAVFVL